MFNLIKLACVILFLTGCATFDRACHDRLEKKNFPSEVSISRDLLFETANLEQALEKLRVDIGCDLLLGVDRGVPIYYGFSN